MCSPDIDTSGQNAAALKASEMSADQWEYSKNTLMPYYMDRQAKLDEMTSQVTGVQLGIQRQLADQGADLYDYNKLTFRPAEQSLVAQSMQDSTPEAYQRYAATAAARTGATFQNAMSAAERDLRSRGVSAGTAAGVAASRQAAVQAALAGGQAFNAASAQAEDRGWARKMDAVGIGRNLAGASAGAYSAATGAGSAATGASNDASRTAGSTIGTAGQYQQMAATNNSNAGSMYSDMAKLQAASDPTNALLGAAGQAAGMYFASDEDMKEEIEPAKALRGINRTKVSTWKYKADSGTGDGETHVGPMAQELRKNLGDKVAPGGRKVSIEQMRAARHNAVDALEAKVDALKAELESMEAEA